MGSAHCVGMCGPLLLQFSRNLAYYHLGRLLAYVGLGALAGWLGESLLPWSWLNVTATVTLVIFFLFSAYRVWRGGGEVTFLPRALTRRLERPLKWASHYGQAHRSGMLALGLLTSLLPCGWLHAFLAAAVGSASPVRGALVLFAFWAGTVPALAMSQSLLRRILIPVGKRYPVAVAILLLFAAVGTIAVRYRPHEHACHHHALVEAE